MEGKAVKLTANSYQTVADEKILDLMGLGHGFVG